MISSQKRGGFLLDHKKKEVGARLKRGQEGESPIEG